MFAVAAGGVRRCVCRCRLFHSVGSGFCSAQRTTGDESLKTKGASDAARRNRVKSYDRDLPDIFRRFDGFRGCAFAFFGNRPVGLLLSGTDSGETRSRPVRSFANDLRPGCAVAGGLPVSQRRFAVSDLRRSFVQKRFSNDARVFRLPIFFLLLFRLRANRRKRVPQASIAEHARTFGQITESIRAKRTPTADGRSGRRLF